MLVGPSLIGAVVFALIPLIIAVWILWWILRTSVWRACGAFAIRVVVTVAFARALRATVVEAFTIPTRGMAPTLIPGDRVLVDKTAYWFKPPSRGDLVVFYPPHSPAQAYVQRVVAVPGDVVWVRHGEPHVNEPVPAGWAPDGNAAKSNGKQVVTPESVRDGPRIPRADGSHTPLPATKPAEGHRWLDLHPAMNQGPITVPPKCLYMIGDNWEWSLDSRFWGCADVAKVAGKVGLVYWSVEPLPDPRRWAPPDVRVPDGGAGLSRPGRVRWERLGTVR
ncbi:MAG: signal peptidase I [Phycisphaerae bacterium]